MTYEEFEWHILRMVYEHGLDRIQPAYVAYAMGIPHEKASDYLDRAAQSGVLEMEVTEDGCIEYFVPGIDPSAERPNPIWKSDTEQLAAETAAEAKAAEARADEPELEEKRPDEPAQHTARAAQGATSPETAEATAEAEPSGQLQETTTEPPPAQKGMDGTIEARSGAPGSPDTSSVPAPLQEHIQGKDEHTDGSVRSQGRHGLPIVDREVSVHSEEQPNVVSALEESDHDLPIQIESTEETFSDPSQTIFMRQLRVEGVESEAALRQHIHRLFDSLGYQMVDADAEGDRMRFERGSVTFILALVPLFVLVLPLFVYLFLYCMGRSTIHQEPLELDVQLRKNKDRDDVYDIDLTFIGLHGVVLGSADQRVLDKEVDTLRDELQWALTTS